MEKPYFRDGIQVCPKIVFWIPQGTEWANTNLIFVKSRISRLMAHQSNTTIGVRYSPNTFLSEFGRPWFESRRGCAVFSSDPAVSSSIFVAERGENLIRNDPEKSKLFIFEV